ncbi:hypothetical protein [Sediminitomix flava]|uniref:Uncharacterized protein n=1 Tax=Sediminitomix flava TaxID=379075 RepID=A0A315ZHW6_SEDFL|nr:hypothetical protein [Sediminitomix flava]PWJ44809.1 hypothetical protein BC781_1011187 [Sediminitomix flava]
MRKLIKLSSYVLALIALSFMTSCGGEDESNPDPLNYASSSVTQTGREFLIESGDLQFTLTFSAPDYSKGTIETSVSSTAQELGLDQIEQVLGVAFDDISGSFDANANTFGNNITATITSVSVGATSVSLTVTPADTDAKGTEPVILNFNVQ